MCWIGIKKFNIINLHDYMDDFFSWGSKLDFTFHKGISRPRPQAQLLMLWDKIGCPWKETKQESGIELKIIGFFVDINCGTLTLTDEAILNILAIIQHFLETLGCQPSLCKWLSVGGHLNVGIFCS